jgi:hypothetical protein
MLSPILSKRLQMLSAGLVGVMLVFQHDLCQGVLIMFAWLFPGVVALVFGGLAVDAVVWRIRNRSGRHYIGALLLAAALGPALPFTNIPFCWVSAAQKLARNESQYDRLVRDVVSGRHPEAVYMVEAGPPLRIVFLWGGVADNWFGVVHDESASIETAGPEALGGQLTRVMHLWGPWFYVALT